MTTEIDISRKRGDTRRITFKVKDSESGDVVDISAWTDFFLSVNSDKKPDNTDNQIAQFSGSLTTDGTDGRVYFTPAGTEPVGKYYYDCQAIDNNSEKITFVEGLYELTQDRTKD